MITGLLRAVRENFELSSALDVGCGVGYFSKFLSDLGFRVVAVDGREQNTLEAKRRYQGIEFLTADAEYLSANQIGTFDFVLCVGLLYHLENPFRVIRNLYDLTQKVLFVESAIAHGSMPGLFMIDEPKLENQGLSYVAFYPTESCLVKTLYRAGFSFIYGFKTLPNYSLFQETPKRLRERTMLVASKHQLAVPGLELLPEPECSFDFWIPADRRPWWSPGRIVSFFRWFVSALRAPSKTA